ncbi:MAG: Calx-beta domain-containing protein [Actinomycetota bacterium]
MRPLPRSRSRSAVMALAMLAATLALLVTESPPARAAMPLGSVSILTNDDPQCGRLADGAECHKFNVASCPGVAASAEGWFSILEPTGAYRGAILFFSGGGGNYYWGEEKDTPGDGAALLTDRLRQDGFRILQVRWALSWEAASPGEQAGAAVACRPATITKFLHDTEYTNAASGPGVCGFCVSGASGGSAQTAYSLSHFGLDAIVDGAFPISGPTHAAIAKGCAPDRTWEYYAYDGPSTKRVDGPFGYVAESGPFAASNGPCTIRSDDPSWIPKWNALSIDVGGNDYEHPATRVHMLEGQSDKVMRAHAADYVRRLAEGGPAAGHQDASPWVALELVPRMDHGISTFTDGVPANQATTLDKFPGLVRLHVAILKADPAAFAACGNGRDDDGDGHGDFTGVADPDPTVTGEPALTADPGCSSPADASESADPAQGAPACDDGLDNDGDGRYDRGDDEFADEGCATPSDESELIPTGPAAVACDDGADTNGDGVPDVEVDNDGDGRANFPDDPGCTSDTDQTPTGNAEKANGVICDDGIDNDGDGKADYLAAGGGDPDCSSPEFPSEAPTAEPPSISIADGSVIEGPSGSTASLAFQVTLSKVSSTAVSFGFVTANGSAVSPGDYTAKNTALTIGAGNTSRTVTVVVRGDAVDESDETFTASITSADATVADGTGVGLILDDDDAAGGGVTITVQDGSVTEADPGTDAKLKIKIKLSASSTQTVTVQFATAGGTATEGTDYKKKTGTLTFQPGQTVKTVAISVIGDSLDEANESFTVTLSDPTSATIADGQAIGTIVDDD